MKTTSPKKQYEVLEPFVLKAGDDALVAGEKVLLTPAQAKKFGSKVRQVKTAPDPEPRLSEESEKPEEAEERLQNPQEEVKVDSGEPEDYLRPYQYKIVNNVAKMGTPDTNPSPGSKAEAMKRHLLHQPKVKMFIPRPPNENKNILQSVTLNGYRLDLPKNAYIFVPEQIAEVLMESLQQTEQGLAQNLISDLPKHGKDEAYLT